MLHRITLYPRSPAASSTPRKMPANRLFITSGMTTASTKVCFVLSPLATASGRYCVSASSASMRRRVSSEIRRPGSWLATRDTVDGWTPARAASSFSVTGTRGVYPTID